MYAFQIRCLFTQGFQDASSQGCKMIAFRVRIKISFVPLTMFDLGVTDGDGPLGPGGQDCADARI